jgi:hypothetical protein
VGGVRGVVVVVVLLVLAGCTTVEGTPEPAPPGTSASAAPARPREVRVDGVDPCSLLTEAQRAELGLDGRPAFDSSPSLLYPGEVPLCLTRGFSPRAVAVAVGVVTTAGIEFFTAGDLAADVRPVKIAGFPAAVALPTRFTEFCSVVVDVAPGQMIDVQFRDGGRRPPIPQEQLCNDAERTADAVMATLLALR